MVSKVGSIDTDRYRHIAHVEQRGKCEEELAECRPFPLSPEMQNIVGEEVGSGWGWGRRMRGGRISGGGTSKRAARHGTAQTLSF
jgi:hypothetical protein